MADSGLKSKVQREGPKRSGENDPETKKMKLFVFIILKDFNFNYPAGFLFKSFHSLNDLFQGEDQLD